MLLNYAPLVACHLSLFEKKKWSYLWCIHSYNTNNVCSGVCMVSNSQNPNHSILRDKCRVILIIVRETKNKNLSERERERETFVFLKTPKPPLFFSHNTILWIPSTLSLSLKHTKPKKEKRKWKTKKENQSIRSNTQFTHFTLSDQNFYFYFF